MWNQLFYATLLLTTISAKKVHYDGYQVYRITPTDESQVKILRDLEISNKYDFWKDVANVNRSADVMVSPKQLDRFLQTMRSGNMIPVRTIENVQKLIDEEQLSSNTRASYNWNSYASLEQIYAWLDSLPAQYGRDIVQVVQAGASYEGRPLKGVKITFPNPANTVRRAIFLEGGIHAREWISPAVVTYMLDRILGDTDPNVRAAVEQYDWHVFPMLNPDGYKFTQASDRLWRKNRQPWTILPILSGTCKGTDLNRNWGYHWGQTIGASPYPCNDQYAGKKVFSAPESQRMSSYITSIQRNLAVYLSFHSYSQYILLPYGDGQTPGANAVEVFDVATAAAKSLKQKYGTQYKVGNNIELLKYYVTGTSSDWVKYTFRTPIVMTFELRDQGSNGFVLPASQIIPSGKETFDALVTITREAAARGYK